MNMICKLWQCVFSIKIVFISHGFDIHIYLKYWHICIWMVCFICHGKYVFHWTFFMTNFKVCFIKWINYFMWTLLLLYFYINWKYKKGIFDHGIIKCWFLLLQNMENCKFFLSNTGPSVNIGTYSLIQV